MDPQADMSLRKASLPSLDAGGRADRCGIRAEGRAPQSLPTLLPSALAVSLFPPSCHQPWP